MTKIIIITSFFWINITLAAYCLAVTLQWIIIPNHAGYVEVRQNDIIGTPNGIDVEMRKNSLINDFVKGE